MRSKRDWGEKRGRGKRVTGYGVSNEDELWSLGEKHVHEDRFECVGDGGRREYMKGTKADDDSRCEC